MVVPLVGTWIEILSIRIAPMAKAVVPLVGTWIEITVPSISRDISLVVPLVGTWIEIYLPFLHFFYKRKSFPSWERGLKYLFYFLLLK